VLEPPSALAVTAPRALEAARGVLYLAAESAVDKPRAVLVLPVSAGSRPDLDGIRQLCGLVHPNLLQVLEAGRTEEELFAASEWLVGCSLAELVARAAERQVRIPIATALYLAREVARGLHAAHMHGGSLAAHGGVAPSNILCGEGGEVKLGHRERLELLLAGSLTAPSSAEASAARPLLPPLRVRPYQAADQAWGAPPTPQGDIYALGAVLWELLTGRRLHDDDPGLFGLEQVATVGAARGAAGGGEVEADPLDATVPQPGLMVPPSAYARDLPPSVDALVLRALDPRPEERFASVEELRQALSRELARLAPEHPERDGGVVAALLREVLGDELAQKRAEQEWLIESARVLWTRGRAPSSGGRPESGAAGSGFAERASPFPSSAALTIPPELAKTQPGPPRRPVQSPEERLDREQLIDGRYRLRRLVGVGGMGAVYEAEHTAICKRVALKILHPQFSKHADLVERLRREAQAASRIGHPNIVDVTDFGRTEDGSAYLAMEYLHGTDLGAILRARGRLDEPRTLHIGVQLVRALAAAHRVGIIHRDLKPENVFLVDPLDWTEAEGARVEFEGVPSQGQDLVKVLDFGIAMQAESMPRPLPRAARLTSPGLTVGTPEYMAPEQAMGLKVDPRADIYAVGTMLYEMLCARVPFIAGSVPELLTLKTCQDAPPPHLWLPAISPAFEAVILRCLLRDPAARPQSMEELERELIVLAAEQGIVLDPMRSGGLLSRGHYLGSERPPSGTPSTTTRAASEAPAASRTASRPGGGRVAVVAGADSDSRLQPLEQVTDLYGGTAPEQLVATAAGSAATAPPRWTARFRRTLIGTVLAVGMVIIGFTSARFVPRRARPVPPPPPAQPALPSAALESVPVVALRPAGLPVTPSTTASELLDRDRAPGPPGEGERPPSSPRAENHTAMLTEWARRAAAGGRYIAPPGDNLVELLKRIEAVAPEAPELGQLRTQAAAAINNRAREQLRRRHTLAALDSYRALQALQPHAPFPRAELAVQLAATARAIHKGAQATALAQTAVELAPGLAVTHLALGDTLLAQGQRGAAAVEYRRTLALLPQGSESRQALRGLARTAHTSPAHGKHGRH
jgi:serine/threonine protein kinase